MITKTKIKQIYGLASKVGGLDDEALHCLVFKLTGNGHISRLTDAQTLTVVKELMRLQNSVTKNGKISDGQKKKIYKLMYELKWTLEENLLDIKRLNSFVKRCTKVDNYKWLTYYQASKVVEGLKNILERA